MLSKQELIEMLIRVDGITPELNSVDCVICMSDILKEACQVAGVEPQKAVTLGNRVSTKRFYPLPQTNYDPQVIRVLFVGRLEAQKNVHGITTALVRLREQGWKISLDVCGGKEINPYLRQAVSILQPFEWRYRGSVPNRDLPALYQTVDMYVGPSFFEGFQIPLIEALACGKPCVASNQPPANEIVTPDVGALVDPADPNSIAAGILSVKNRLNNARESLFLRAACRARASQKWDYFVISKQEVELYLKVLNNFWSKQSRQSKGKINQLKKDADEKYKLCTSKAAPKNTVSIIPLTNDLKEEWNKVVYSSDDAWLYHTFEWQVLLSEAWQANVFSFAIEDQGEIAAIFPLVVMPNSTLLDSTFGPAGIAFRNDIDKKHRTELFGKAMACIKELMEKSGLKRFRISLPPLTPNSNENFESLLMLAGFKDISTNTFILNLVGKDIDEVWNNFTKTMRYDIRQARKKEFEIALADSPEDMEDYYRLHVQTYERTGAKPHPKEYFQAIWKYFGTQGMARFFLARHEGKVVGADNIAVFKNCAVYWTNASSNDYLKTGVNKLLQWEAIQWAKKNGVERYEIGEAFPDAEKGSKLAGLTFFKKSFGGELHRFPKGLMISSQ